MNKASLNSLLATAQANIFRIVDHIPISQWSFDETSLDWIKQQKEAAVKLQLQKAKQKKLKEKQKFRNFHLAVVVPETISEVFDVLARSKFTNKTPKKPNFRILKGDESKENGPELDPKIAEILKKKRVGKRPFVRNAININSKSGDAGEDESGVPFKKQRKQRKPPTEADKEKRREARKLNRKKISKEKMARNVELKKEEKPDATAGEAQKPEENEFGFSKLDFVIKDKKPPTSRERKEKLSGRDYTSLQKKVQKRSDYVEKIREKNPEKAKNLEERIKWDTAQKRAEGQKVKDDPTLLEKAAKRKEKVKKVRKQKWDDRVKKVEQEKEKRQEKRETNIAKRRDDKVNKKLERLRKKGRLV